MTASDGLLLPRLLPPHWDGVEEILCEPLIGDTVHWNGKISLPWVAYGIDRGETFEFFAPDRTQLVALRCAARGTLPTLSVKVMRHDLGGLEVYTLSGIPYAAEKTLDPAFMRLLQRRLDTTVMAVGLPRSGRAVITSGTQGELELRRFVHVVQTEYDAAPEPLFAHPVLIQAGDPVGILRLADDDDDDDEGLETLRLNATNDAL